MSQLTTHIIIVELIHPDDTAPRIKQLTPSAATFLGYSEKELIGSPIDLIYAAGRDKALWQAALGNISAKSAGQSPSARLRTYPSTTLRTCFSGEIVTKTNTKTQALISLSALSSRTPVKNDIVLLIQDRPFDSAQDRSVLSNAEGSVLSGAEGFSA